MTVKLGEYGVVRVTSGEHAGKIGYYDNDGDDGAIVYFCAVMSGPYCVIPTSCLERATDEEIAQYNDEQGEPTYKPVEGSPRSPGEYVYPPPTMSRRRGLKAPDDGAGDLTLGMAEQATMADGWGEGGSCIFEAGIGRPEGKPARLELRPNGDILVNGDIAANDQDVVDGFRQWLSEARAFRHEVIRARKQELIEEFQRWLRLEATQDGLGLEVSGSQARYLAEHMADYAIDTWTRLTKAAGFEDAIEEQ